MDDLRRTLNDLNAEIVVCRRCPRLVDWREHIAITKKKAFMEWEYWGKPVTGFGEIDGRILILGLAPGAHGSNRTGRMFTGDGSGNFLYPALYSAGFANQPISASFNDGLELKDIFISAVCRCAPPDNKPAKEEISNCREYLLRELALMENLNGIVALGKVAFDSALGLLEDRFGAEWKDQPKFGHGKLYFSKGNSTASTPWLLSSYHPSRQNTQTGRLTQEMFLEIWEKAKDLLENPKEFSLN